MVNKLNNPITSLLLATFLVSFLNLSTDCSADDTGNSLESYFRNLEKSDRGYSQQKSEDMSAITEEVLAENDKVTIETEILPILFKYLDNDNQQVQIKACGILFWKLYISSESLNLPDDSQDILLRGLNNPGANLKECFVMTISFIKPAPPNIFVSPLLDIIDKEPIRTKVVALNSLGKFRPIQEKVRTVLVKRAKEDESSRVRAAAIFGLSEFGSKDKESTMVIVNALNDRSWFVRQQSIEALGLKNATDQEVLKGLFQVVRDNTETDLNRSNALGAINSLGGNDPIVLQTFITILEEDYPEKLKYSAIAYLSKKGSKAIIGLPILQAIVGDPYQSEYLVQKAESAIKTIESSP